MTVITQNCNVTVSDESLSGPQIDLMSWSFLYNIGLPWPFREKFDLIQEPASCMAVKSVQLSVLQL